MNGFTRTNLIVWGVAVTVFLQVEAASGQFVPRRHSGGYGGYDGAIYPDINQTNAALQQAYTQEREYQAQSSMARTSTLGGASTSRWRSRPTTERSR